MHLSKSNQEDIATQQLFRSQNNQSDSVLDQAVGTRTDN